MRRAGANIKRKRPISRLQGRSVAVTGGREYKNAHRLFEVLDLLKPAFLILGDAKGADYMAREYGKMMVRKDTGGFVVESADWKRLGKRAGPARNAEMLNHEPEFVLAFPGGRGTENMVTQAKRRGILVVRVDK